MWEGDLEDLAGSGVVAVASATGLEPVAPAGEPVPTVPESVLVVAGQERGQHVEGRLPTNMPGRWPTLARY